MATKVQIFNELTGSGAIMVDVRKVRDFFEWTPQGNGRAIEQWEINCLYPFGDAMREQRLILHEVENPNPSLPNEAYLTRPLPNAFRSRIQAGIDSLVSNPNNRIIAGRVVMHDEDDEWARVEIAVEEEAGGDVRIDHRLIFVNQAGSLDSRKIES